VARRLGGGNYELTITHRPLGGRAPRWSSAHLANGEIRTVNLDIVRSEGTRTNEPQTVGYSRKADHAKPVILNPEPWGLRLRKPTVIAGSRGFDVSTLAL